MKKESQDRMRMSSKRVTDTAKCPSSSRNNYTVIVIEFVLDNLIII